MPRIDSLVHYTSQSCYLLTLYLDIVCNSQNAANGLRLLKAIYTMTATWGNKVARNRRQATGENSFEERSAASYKPTGHLANRRPPLPDHDSISLNDVAPVYVQIRKLSVSINHKLSTPPSRPAWSQAGTATLNGQLGVQTYDMPMMQQDILLLTLTARMTLQYAAEMPLPPSTPTCACQRVIGGVIRELGLKDCAEACVGSSQHRGCSGGDKRRVSIVVPLPATPSVLFLDEPSTASILAAPFSL
ncbi:hypothetical protein XA68_13021 [Ophiocordyceps unilateralis]|uniref:ABC transporter domain-containing protein n=1 Tax=Ophiocordyceps unilateralis TaxID=268505 RepID=A0A2A9PBR1_OPHUN|nr:hypothetical protein XA68_13021 [Ophiocordyceps unilateralis]